MAHSKYFLKVKNYWIHHLWGIKRLMNAVVMKWITEEEFLEITGIPIEEAGLPGKDGPVILWSDIERHS